MARMFTIGYSGLDMPGFTALLAQHGVAVVCDVRSTPFSRFKPDFSRGPFRRHLNAAGVKYVFLGRELGARPEDRGCYVGGQARYDRIAATEPFRLGLDRVRNGAATTRLALVCSERDPVECHRAILVAHRLPDLHEDIAHIHTDGRLETQGELDDRLVALHGLTPPPLLSAPGDADRARALAYDKQADAIAYRERG